MKSIHDLIAEFEAEVASLFAKFRATISQHSSPAAAVASDPPADFGPISPDGSPSPAPKPADPPAPPAPQPDTPRPVNDYDPTAPGFQMPANPSPAPVPAAPAASDPDYMNGTDFDASQVPVLGANFIFMGGQKTKTLRNLKGKIRVTGNQRAIPATQPYTLTANGVSVHQDMVAASTIVLVDADANGGTVVVSVSQPDDSSVVVVPYQD